jgi:hypothetical protein
LDEARMRLLYGADGEPGLIDAALQDRPEDPANHMCLFTNFSSNPSFREMIHQSVRRLRARNVFAPAFVDVVVRRFEQRKQLSQEFDGLVSTDLALEAGWFE